MSAESHSEEGVLHEMGGFFLSRVGKFFLESDRIIMPLLHDGQWTVLAILNASLPDRVLLGPVPSGSTDLAHIVPAITRFINAAIRAAVTVAATIVTTTTLEAESAALASDLLDQSGEQDATANNTATLLLASTASAARDAIAFHRTALSAIPYRLNWTPMAPPTADPTLPSNSAYLCALQIGSLLEFEDNRPVTKEDIRQMTAPSDVTLSDYKETILNNMDRIREASPRNPGADYVRGSEEPRFFFRPSLDHLSRPIDAYSAFAFERDGCTLLLHRADTRHERSVLDINCLIVYTDGSSVGDPLQQAGWSFVVTEHRAGCLTVHDTVVAVGHGPVFPSDSPFFIGARNTSGGAEISAIVEGLLWVYHESNKLYGWDPIVVIASDSQDYLDKITGGRSDTANRDCLNLGLDLIKDLGPQRLAFLKAKAHSGLAQNELADIAANVGRYRLAVSGRFLALAAATATGNLPVTSDRGHSASEPTIATLVLGERGSIAHTSVAKADGANTRIIPREILTAPYDPMDNLTRECCCGCGKMGITHLRCSTCWVGFMASVDCLLDPMPTGMWDVIHQAASEGRLVQHVADCRRHRKVPSELRSNITLMYCEPCATTPDSPSDGIAERYLEDLQNRAPTPDTDGLSIRPLDSGQEPSPTPTELDTVAGLDDHLDPSLEEGIRDSRPHSFPPRVRAPQRASQRPLTQTTLWHRTPLHSLRSELPCTTAEGTSRTSLPLTHASVPSVIRLTAMSARLLQTSRTATASRPRPRATGARLRPSSTPREKSFRRFSIRASSAPLAGWGLQINNHADNGEWLGKYSGDELPRSNGGPFVFERADGTFIDGTPRHSRDYGRVFSYVNVALWNSEMSNVRMDGDGNFWATKRLKKGIEIFLASYGRGYNWLPYQCALVRRAISAARDLLANSISAVARQIRIMRPCEFLLDLVRNRSPLDARAAGLLPREFESPRQWFTRAFAHPTFGGYCTFRRAGAPGELTPNWTTLLGDPTTPGRYNLRSASHTNYAEEEIAIDLSGSDMLADDSLESTSDTSEGSATVEDLNTAGSEEESSEDGKGQGDPLSCL